VNPSDQELMNQVKDGAVEQLGLLFERHHPRLFNFCLRLTGDRQASEDLVQEVFYRILKYRHTFRADSDFLVWTYQMTRNACADHFHKQARMATADDEPAEPVGQDPLPLEELESAESLELLGKALRALPLDKREVLVLSRFRDLKYEQIAELLGCTVGAVKVRVHRALRQLRDVYLRLAASPTGSTSEVTP